MRVTAHARYERTDSTVDPHLATNLNTKTTLSFEAIKPRTIAIIARFFSREVYRALYNQLIYIFTRFPDCTAAS